MLGDERVMRFFGGGTPMSADRAAAWCADQSRVCDDRAFGPWTVRLQGSEEPVGWGGLVLDPYAPGWGVEVGYFFEPSLWGLGYATELVRAAVRYGTTKVGLIEIEAYVRPANHASKRVLEKTGFVSRGYVPELERVHYRYTAGARGADG
jgi:RimJ/RimL family protein N-acetyltransferase